MASEAPWSRLNPCFNLPSFDQLPVVSCYEQTDCFFMWAKSPVIIQYNSVIQDDIPLCRQLLPALTMGYSYEFPGFPSRANGPSSSFGGAYLTE